MESAFLTYRNSSIHYIRFGSGSKHLFAFHGFSENATSFLTLESSLGQYYTIYAFDIPFHGETKWNEEEPFAVSDLLSIVDACRQQNGIDRFSVLGFSMGGKCALYLTAAFAKDMDALWLLASDGIQTNKIYNVAVYPAWGRKLFHTTIDHPGWFFAFIRISRALRMLSPWLYKFTTNHMNTREKRQRLYDTWISMSRFNPDIDVVKREVQKYAIRCFLFFGIRDEVIPVSVGAAFADGLDNCTLVELQRGHYFIDEKLNPFIEEELRTM
ncbi:MAG: alpha/beta fold hydrolase [Chitinophagales bacterium]